MGITILFDRLTVERICFAFSGILIIMAILFTIHRHLSSIDNADNNEESEARNAIPARTRYIIMDFLSFVIPIAIVIMLFKFVVMIGIEQTGSMQPTLEVGGIQITNRLAYKMHPVERGDIIAFKSPIDTDDRVFVKRVIGLPGESIAFADGDVYINGTLLDEPYLVDDTESNSKRTFDVPAGCVFVMGDNRENSQDSRDWLNTYVDTKTIYGKMVFEIPPVWNKAEDNAPIEGKMPVYLPLGQYETVYVYDQDAVKPAMISIYNRLDHDEVKEIVTQYIASGKAPYEAPPELPAGCHWEGVVYMVRYNAYADTNPDSYVNIKLRSADGNKLTSDGIPFSKKTHDIDIYAYLDDQNTLWDMICYYAVPDNCESYALELGEGTLDNQIPAIYSLFLTE